MIAAIFRYLPKFKGKQRLARFLLRSEIRSGNDITVKGKRGCIYKIPNANENIGFEILINGIYEEETIDFILLHLDKGKILLDIGANIGSITIPVCKQRPDVEAIAVEASPWIATYLKRNVELNQLKKIRIIEKAIAEVAGNQVDFFSPHDKFGKGSLSPIFTQQGVKVETTTIDALAASVQSNNISLIKIDVEGFEYFAFLGGAKTLKKKDAPDILFEFVDWAEELAGVKVGAAQEILLSYGYYLYVLEKNRHYKINSPVTSGGLMLFASKEEMI